MTDVKISRIPPLKTELAIPGDKSISHRAVMLSSIAQGETLIKNFLAAQDCLDTVKAFEEMGVLVKRLGKDHLIIDGKGLYGLSKPPCEIYLGNSGTSARLLLGIMAGQQFEAIVSGDESLCKRPMKRVTQPLRAMGADIKGKDDADFLPLNIKGARPLRPVDFKLPIPSAQVKSCLMLAALYADGTSYISEPQQSRDHTERMFKLFKADMLIRESRISVKGAPITSPGELKIPSDISSAAFFITLGLLLPKSEITIKGCGVNPTRMGFVDILKRMGADIKIINLNGNDYEPYADIIVKSSQLKSITVQPNEIPKMIDEIPALALVAAYASGETVIKGTGELRVKETDRVNSIVTNLRAMGTDIKAVGDSIIIKGPTKLKPARVNSFKDHRTAMMMIIAGCLSEGETIVEDTDCIDTSFPGFIDIINRIS